MIKREIIPKVAIRLRYTDTPAGGADTWICPRSAAREPYRRRSRREFGGWNATAICASQ